MNPVIRSIAAIFAGIAAFFVVGGIVFGAMYLIFFDLLPKPTGWMELVNNINGMLCFMIAVTAGSIAGGYAIAGIAERARFIHSVIAVAFLYLLHHAYVYWGPDTLWDKFYDPNLEAVLACLPFFVLGTWIGSRKRKQIEKPA